MSKELTHEEAKKVISEYPDEEDFIQAHFRQFLTMGEYDDNSIELSDHWKNCKKIVDKTDQ